jgi:quinolinate synthase
MLYRLRKDSPGKQFYPACEAALCRNMKKNSLEKVLRSLEIMKPVITVQPEVRERAKAALDKMLEYSRTEEAQ